MTDDEGTEASGEEIGKSMQKGFVRPLYTLRPMHTPHSHAMQESNSPKDAQAAEEKGSEADSGKYDNGSPAQTEEAEKTEREPNHSSNEKFKSDYQDPKDKEPKPQQQGPARSASVVSLVVSVKSIVHGSDHDLGFFRTRTRTRKKDLSRGTLNLKTKNNFFHYLHTPPIKYTFD